MTKENTKARTIPIKRKKDKVIRKETGLGGEEEIQLSSTYESVRAVETPESLPKNERG